MAAFRRGFKAALKEGANALIGHMALRASAEEAPENAPEEPEQGSEREGAPTPTINYEDLIAKARKEEKEKQYKAIERYKSQVKTLTEQHNADLLAVADLEKRLQEASDKLTSAGSGDSEEVRTLKESLKAAEEKNAELDKRVKELEGAERPSREDIEKEVRAELEGEYEVRAYKAEKLAELKDQILVPELVGGDTKEDVDKSIEAALARSEEIRKALGAGEEKPKRTPKSPAAPTGGGKEIDLDYLASLDVRSPEYAKIRQQLGLR